MLAAVLSVLVAWVGQGSGAGNDGCTMVASDKRADRIVLLILTGKKRSNAGSVRAMETWFVA